MSAYHRSRAGNRKRRSFFRSRTNPASNEGRPAAPAATSGPVKFQMPMLGSGASLFGLMGLLAAVGMRRRYR